MSHSLPPRATAVLLALVLALLVFRLGAVPARRPRRAPLHPRRGRDAPGRRVGDADARRASPGSRRRRSSTGWPGGAFSVLGETEAAARVPSVLAALLLVGATALFGARLYGSAAGLHAGFVAGTSLLPFAYGRAASMDMLLAATVTVAIGLAGLRLLGDRRAASRSWPRPRLRPASRRSPRARSASCCRSWSLGGYVARHARVALAPRDPLPAARSPPSWSWPPPGTSRSCSTRAGTSWTSSSSNHNVQRFTSTVHNHPGPVLVLRARPARRASSRGRGSRCPRSSASSPRASRADLFVLLWLGAAARLLLARRLEAARLHPALRAAARDPDGPRRRPPDHGRPGRPSGCSRAASWRSSASCWRRSSPRRPAALFRIREPLWRSAVPLGVWAVVVAFFFSRRVGARPRRGPAAPAGRGGRPAAPARRSPRRRSSPAASRAARLFAPAMGREVLAWGAWRTAWMAGYFYNDGKVREVERGERDPRRRSTRGRRSSSPGPSERRRLEAMGSLEVHILARGPRENALLRVEKRPE